MTERLFRLGESLTDLRPSEDLLALGLRKVRTAIGLLPGAVLHAVNAVWALPAVLVMRLIRPWLLIRVRRVHYERIGHFTGDTALFLAQQLVDETPVKTLNLYWFASGTSNDQWARMVRRKLFVRWWVRYLIAINRVIPGGESHVVPFVKGTRDTRALLQRTPVRFEFEDNEHQAAKAWLTKRGWKESEPFVCLLVRDSAYLDAYQGDGSARWDYHSYRDSEIETYADAATALLARGYWVIRMGRTMRRPLPVSHACMIDYPFVDDQDDLLDVWLAAHCSFFVSTGTGIDMVPVVFGRPVVFVNFNPFNNLFSFANSITVPKHLRWRESGRPLTLREHFEHGYTRTGDYERAGISLTSLGPDEIVAAVMECADRLAGTWRDTADDQSRQRRFWDAARRAPGFNELHGFVHPQSRAGSIWLKSMGEGFLEH